MTTTILPLPTSYSLWKKQGLFCPEGTLTWNSQATFVLMLPDGTPMYMGDRWSYPHQASCATYVWLPMQVDGERLSIPTFWQAWNPQTVCPSDRLKAAKKRNTLTLRSNQPGKTIRLKFKGTHVALTGKTDWHGGYARVSVVDSTPGGVFLLGGFLQQGGAGRHPRSDTQAALRHVHAERGGDRRTLELERQTYEPVWYGRLPRADRQCLCLLDFNTLKGGVSKYYH